MTVPREPAIHTIEVPKPDVRKRQHCFRCHKQNRRPIDLRNWWWSFQADGSSRAYCPRCAREEMSGLIASGETVYNPS